MASGPAAKVLVVGPPAGQLRTFLTKTNAIHDKHGPFDALFVLGNLFSPSPPPDANEDELDQLLQGALTCKIPTYFTLGTGPLPLPVLNKIEEAAEASGPIPIASNLFYLGSSGVATISAAASPHPLNVAFIGGQWDPQAWSKAPLFNDPNPATAQETESTSNPITPRQLHTLLAHPSLALSKPPPPRARPPKRKKNDIMAELLDDGADQPVTLAEARAQQAAKLAALTAASSRPSGPALPSIAAGLTVEDETEAPTRPAIDILLLPYFPATILKPPPQARDERNGKRKASAPAPLDLASLPHPTMPSWGAAPLATLTARARARYVFALGPGPLSPTQDPVSIPGLEDEDERRQVGTFFERAPFYHPASAQQSSSHARKPLTRFISLANLANPKKVRWFMALNLPLGPHQAPPVMPENITASPYGMLGFERSAKDLTGTDSTSRNPNMQKLGTGAGSKHSSGATSADDGSNPNFRFSSSHQRGTQQVPPRGYICRLCSRSGHFIQDCELAASKKGSENGEGQNGATSTPATTTANDSILPPPGYECRICLSPTHIVKRCPFNPSSAERNADPSRPNKKQRRDGTGAGPRAIPVGPTDCWFCLSNPACAKHLIIGIGSECYLSLPKGQLTPAPAEAESGKPGVVPGGGHVLIIPINHTPSYLASSLSEADRTKILSERTDYLRALSAVYATHGTFPLSWEIGRSEGSTGTRVGHTQTQVVPVPLSLRKGLKDVLEAKAKEAGYGFLSEAEGEEVLAGNRGADYFRMQIGVDPVEGGDGDGDGDGQKAVSFVLLLRGPQSRFSIQWPRQTLASILNTPERADWRFCARETVDEEREEAEAFKLAFQPFAAGIGDDDSDEDEEEESPDVEGY